MLGCLMVVLLSTAVGLLLLHRAYGLQSAVLIVVLSQAMSLAATAYRFRVEIADPHYVQQSTDAFRYLAGGRARWMADQRPLDGIVLGDGTQNIIVVNQWFFEVLGDDPALVFLAGSTCGLLGLWLVALAVRTVRPDSHVLFGYLVCAAPSVVYWSSSFGKDAFTFLSVGACLWVVADVASRRDIHLLAATVFVVADALMFFIRIDIGVVLLVALVLSWGAVRVRGAVRFRTGLLALTFIGAPAALIAATLLGLQDPWGIVKGFGGTYERTSIGDSAMDGGRGSGLVGLLDGFVTAIFRPFPWEFGLGGLVSSIDVLVFLAVVIVGIRVARGAHVWRLADARIVVFGSLFVIAVFAEVSQFANLGLMVRLRSLIIPVLLAIIAVVVRSSEADSFVTDVDQFSSGSRAEVVRISSGPPRSDLHPPAAPSTSLGATGGERAR